MTTMEYPKKKSHRRAQRRIAERRAGSASRRTARCGTRRPEVGHGEGGGVRRPKQRLTGQNMDVFNQPKYGDLTFSSKIVWNMDENGTCLFGLGVYEQPP